MKEDFQNQIKQTNTDCNKNFESKLDEINLKLNVLNEAQSSCKLEQSEHNEKLKTEIYERYTFDELN